MTIGHVPIRERLVFPRRQEVPLSHVLRGDDWFPADTDAYLYLYGADETELAFWPLTVTDNAITIDINDWWAYREARSFTVFVVYAAEPTKFWPWFEGSTVRTF